MTQTEIDRLYDAFTELVDATPKADRERMLARLCITLAVAVDDYRKVLQAIETTRNSGSGS